MELIRKLEIYHLSSIGCSDTIMLYDWFVDRLSNITIHKSNENNNILYTKNKENLFVFIEKTNNLLVDYNIWCDLLIKCNRDDLKIRLSLTYFLMKLSIITYNYNIKYADLKKNYNIIHKKRLYPKIKK